jgi:hypothetical protein
MGVWIADAAAPAAATATAFTLKPGMNNPKVRGIQIVGPLHAHRLAAPQRRYSDVGKRAGRLNWPANDLLRQP